MLRVDAIFIFILPSRHDTHHEHISINQQKQTGYYLSTEKKHKNHNEYFIHNQDLFKETEIRDSIDISLHLTKDDSKMANVTSKGRLFPATSRGLRQYPFFLNAHTISYAFIFANLPSCPDAIINDICSCNDHLIEVKESNLFAALFSKILFWGHGIFCLCLMLDSLVKYERDKRNFVRYNYNGCRLFIVKELVTF